MYKSCTKVCALASKLVAPALLTALLIAVFCSQSATCAAKSKDGPFSKDHTLGVMYVSSDTLDFGIVNFGTSKTLTDTLLNIGSTNLIISNIVSTDPQEFSIIGNVNPRTIPAGGSGDVYTITFTPIIKMPGGLHLATLTFTYDGGQVRTVTMIGREHTIVNADLHIDTGYYGAPGSDVIVHQFLLTNLSSTVAPVKSFDEQIQYDENILSLTSVTKGVILSTPYWTLGTTTPAPGEAMIVLESTDTASSARLGGPGILLDLHFHVNANAKEGETSLLSASSVSFGGGIEPTITVTPGEFHVSGSCVPTAVTAGNVATSAEQNSPNPFSATTTLRYWINEANARTHVRIVLYDQLGNIVRSLRNDDEANGSYTIAVDSHGLESGVYSYSFQAGGTQTIKRMMVVK